MWLVRGCACWLLCGALLTCCLTASVMPASCCADSRHTPAGLPVPGPSAKASTCVGRVLAGCWQRGMRSQRGGSATRERAGRAHSLCSIEALPLLLCQAGWQTLNKLWLQQALRERSLRVL